MLFNGFELIYVIYLAILNTTYGMDGAHTEHRSKMLFDAFGLGLYARNIGQGSSQGSRPGL